MADFIMPETQLLRSTDGMDDGLSDLGTGGVVTCGCGLSIGLGWDVVETVGN